MEAFGNSSLVRNMEKAFGNSSLVRNKEKGKGKWYPNDPIGTVGSNLWKASGIAKA